MGSDPEHEQLLKRLRKDLFTMTPPSEFRKEILECHRDPSVVDKASGIQKIMQKYGYDKIPAEEIMRLLQWKPDDEVKKPLPPDPPATKPIAEESAPFSLSTFAGIYNVTSEKPPALQIAIVDATDKEPNKIVFLDQDKTKQKTFVPKLEEGEPGEYWISWTDNNNNKASYKVQVWTEFNKDSSKIIRRFAGYISKGADTAAIKFEGMCEDPDPAEASSSSWWEEHGLKVILGAFFVYALGSWIYKKRAEKAKEKKEEARYQEAIQREKVATEQASKHFAETRALAEASAADKFLESTSKAKREALLESIRQGLREKFNEKMDGLPAERKNGELVFDFAGQDHELRKEFEQVVEAKIKAWVDANPNIPGNAALDTLRQQGMYDVGDASDMAERIRAEAKLKVDASMTGEYGEYRDLVDHSLDHLRNEFNRNTLDTSMIDADHQIKTTIPAEVKAIEQQIVNLTKQREKEVQEYKQAKEGKSKAEIQELKDKYNEILDKLDAEIDTRQTKRKTEIEKKDGLEKKKKEAEQTREKAEKDRKEAEKKQREREAHFKEHLKLHH